MADRVTVVSKNNDDNQHIWRSDSSSFEVSRDPRGNTLERGTEVILHLKQEAKEYLQQDVLKKIIKKYSQFVNCPLYLWESHMEKVEEKSEVTETEETSDDAVVEEEKPKEEKKMVEKSVEDWVRINDQKPIWTKKPSEVAAEEYTELFQMLLNTDKKPLAHIHFSAEGEVSFNAVLFIPPTLRDDFLQSDSPITDNIKVIWCFFGIIRLKFSSTYAESLSLKILVRCFPGTWVSSTASSTATICHSMSPVIRCSRTDFSKSSRHA